MPGRLARLSLAWSILICFPCFLFPGASGPVLTFVSPGSHCFECKNRRTTGKYMLLVAYEIWRSLSEFAGKWVANVKSFPPGTFHDSRGTLALPGKGRRSSAGRPLHSRQPITTIESTGEAGVARLDGRELGLPCCPLCRPPRRVAGRVGADFADHSAAPATF